MACTINLEALLGGCADDSFDDGIRIDTNLEVDVQGARRDSRTST